MNYRPAGITSRLGIFNLQINNMEPNKPTPKWKTWHKVTLVIVVLLIIGVLKGKDKIDENTPAPAAAIINMDSIAAVLKKDNVYEVKEVFYNPKDSSLNISVSYKKGDVVAVYYFDKNYSLTSLPNVEGVYLHPYKKGVSLETADNKKSLSWLSKRAGARMEQFKKSGYKYQIENFLEKRVNDPTGLDVMETVVTGENQDGTFAVRAQFRAKNAFGALMMHTVNCDMDMEGNSTHIFYDK